MDMGFWPDVRRIVQALPDSAARQTLLFSATMPEEVMKLADEIVVDAKYVQIGAPAGAAKTITHTAEAVAVGTEDRVAGEVPAPHRTARCWCSCGRSQAPTGWRASWRRSGSKAAALHADRTQQQRTQAVEGFRERHVSRARRDRRRRARPRHRRHHARRELTKCRRAARCTCTASGAPAAREATGTALTLVAPEELRALEALKRSVGIEMQG